MFTVSIVKEPAPTARSEDEALLTPTRATASLGVVHPAMILGILLFIALYWETAVSFVDIWLRSPTFAHGFLIVPISLWLVWRKRDALKAVPAALSYWGALATFLLGAGWLLSHVTGIQVMKHFFMVAMMPALTWAFQGAERVKVIAFPLCFLLFAVPVGEALIPPLIDFTAAFTVIALRVTGIPVYFEGNILRVPTGVWSIEAACSGVRYLIASVTLGCLYAYLAYHSFWRRAVFIAASAIVPIFANGFRAYMIVMIGHLSGMRLAVGVDHFIYGWVFFGIVVSLLFWLGSFWRDEAPSERRAGGGG